MTIATQSSMQVQVPEVVAPYPAFEGKVVDGVAIKLSGNAAALGDSNLDTKILEMDDVVNIRASYKVVGVKHEVDKDGQIIRTHIVKALEYEIVPFDPADPQDDGVVRARRP